MNLLKKHGKLLFVGVLFLILALFIIFGPLESREINRKFEKYTEAFAQNQLASNTLTLHYTLANPTNAGISDYKRSLGRITTDETSYFSTLENEMSHLKSFSYPHLSKENQFVYDILHLYFETELSSDHEYFLMEPFSPTLGIQAQLPSILAEYTFRSKTDLQDYFCLLKDMPDYFKNLLDFEKEKAKHGFFMSNTTVNRIVDQCHTFISADENYMHIAFKELLSQTTFLTEEEQKKCITLHENLIQTYVIPAYQTLIAGLNQLKGTGQNSNGLYYFNGGKEYYTYLIKSNCGIYDSISEIQKQLISQLSADYQELQEILKKDPSLTNSLLFQETTSYQTPEQILSSLQTIISKDFPQIPDVTYQIHTIHETLREYSSPAFYLTPPIDVEPSHAIYLNPDSHLDGIELFTTLAHEGFPGHLYQTQYFSMQNAPLIRHILNMPGYVEGWATYIESYAYQYGSSNKDLGHLFWLTRSMNLCIYSLLDIGIHYYGWNFQKAAAFLNKTGITETAVCQEIFQCILEDPGNYLKYYGGCLQFMDLKTQASAKEDFNLIQFHEEILKIGPCQFPILEKMIG